MVYLIRNVIKIIQEREHNFQSQCLYFELMTLLETKTTILSIIINTF